MEGSLTTIAGEKERLDRPKPSAGERFSSSAARRGWKGEEWGQVRPLSLTQRSSGSCEGLSTRRRRANALSRFWLRGQARATRQIFDRGVDSRLAHGAEPSGALGVAAPVGFYDAGRRLRDGAVRVAHTPSTVSASAPNSTGLMRMASKPAAER